MIAECLTHLPALQRSLWFSQSRVSLRGGRSSLHRTQDGVPDDHEACCASSLLAGWEIAHSHSLAPPATSSRCPCGRAGVQQAISPRHLRKDILLLRAACAGCQSDRMIDPFTDSHPPFLLSAKTGSYIHRADSWPTHRNRQQHKQTIAATYCSCAKSRYQFLQVGESFCWCRSGANALDRMETRYVSSC